MKTATEIRLFRREVDDQIIGLQTVMHDQFIKPMALALYCHSVNGFYKPDNRSPKKLARLKHSLTHRAIARLPDIGI